jgi:L-seryl-tRNA(Ser) seleniumtransferase
VREVLDQLRKKIKNGLIIKIDEEEIIKEVKNTLKVHEKYSLSPVINATGVVIHTNLGRAILPNEAIKHVLEISTNYSNLEFDLKEGKRGKRYVHIIDVVKKIINVESALVVNNNAGAVFLCLNTLAKGKEVIVSRGELVEIGGSFRIPDVMLNSGAILREVGTTNKTHLSDYENAINDNTALLLKVHQSNFRIIGFTEEVSVEELLSISRKRGIPVMVDLGSGCFIDLKKYGLPYEPTVQDVISQGADIVTFSGDKLLGSAQAGFIVGKSHLLEKIAKNPIMRALRVDKMTLAALEATLRLYLDEEEAIKKIPTLKMILEKPENIRKRALKISRLLNKEGIPTKVKEDISFPGGGSLPEIEIKTYVVSLKPPIIPNEFAKKLRFSEPPVVVRIKDDLIIFDARTIQDNEILPLVNAVKEVYLNES